MTALRSLLLPVVLAGGAAAQGTSVSIVAATPIAALTQAASGPATIQGVPSGQPIGVSPNQLFLMTSQAPTGASLSATTLCYPTLPTNGGIGVNFFERANARGAAGDVAGSSAAAQPTGATFGPHAILCTFRNAPGTIGKIRVSFRQAAAATGLTGLRLDIGNDSTVELQTANAMAQDFPCTLGPTGAIDVRVDNECRAAGDGTASSFYSWTEVWVGFLPDLAATCTFTNYGQGCGGVTASGGEVVIGQTRVITMLVAGGFANAPVLAVTGDQSLTVPLPAGCSLLANALSVRLLTANGAGMATDSWSLPVTTVGTAFQQFLPLTAVNGALVLTASNGVQIDCVR